MCCMCAGFGIPPDVNLSYVLPLTCRSQLAVMAALLHDVVDDTRIEFAEVEAAFGAPTAALVATVTRLSQMNQLMRRKARKAREQVGTRPTGCPAIWRHSPSPVVASQRSGLRAGFSKPSCLFRVTWIRLNRLISCIPPQCPLCCWISACPG
jgi:HD domain